MREQRDQIQEYMGGGWVGARRGQNVSESEADMEEKSRWRAIIGGIQKESRSYGWLLVLFHAQVLQRVSGTR